MNKDIYIYIIHYATVYMRVSVNIYLHVLECNVETNAG